MITDSIVDVVSVAAVFIFIRGRSTADFEDRSRIVHVLGVPNLQELEVETSRTKNSLQSRDGRARGCRNRNIDE